MGDMKGMIFFIIGIIIVFGVYSLTQRSTESNDSANEMDKQEIQQELEKMSIDIDPNELEKVE